MLTSLLEIIRRPRLPRQRYTALLVVGTFALYVSHAEAQGRAIDVQWISSVDGAVLQGVLWEPEGYDPMDGPVPLSLWFNGGEGGLNVPQGWSRGLDRKGWLGLIVAGRSWNLEAEYGCRFSFSMAYLNHPDPDIGPGEQDVLDGVDWAISQYPVDADRVYVMGFSLGGRGTYMMGLKRPDRFAGIAPMAPATDLFEVDTRVDPSRTSYPCRMALAQGIPGSSGFSATIRSLQSARFLVENARNLPIYHGHGTNDGLAANDSQFAPYFHGRHMLDDASFDGCHRCIDGLSPCVDINLEFCFGHTPTLSELHAMDPGGYPYAWMTTPVGHIVDSEWLDGTVIGNGQGVIDPADSGRLIGAFDFLEDKVRNSSPDTVVYKSYTDEHRSAYWLEIDVTTPWSGVPGAIRATRNSATNSLQVELARIAALIIDLPDAGLVLDSNTPLRVNVERLSEPVFDPILDASSEDLNPLLTFAADLTQGLQIDVTVNGTPLAASSITVANSSVTIGPLSIVGPTEIILSIATTETGGDSGSGAANGGGSIAVFSLLALVLMTISRRRIKLSNSRSC